MIEGRGVGGRIRFLIVAAASVATCATAAESIEFRPLEDRVDQSKIQVYEGRAPLAGDWRSIIVATMPESSGLRSCTATLIGPKTLLTAAHCVDAGNNVPLRSIVLSIDDARLIFDCEIDSAYLDAGQYNQKEPRSTVSPDYALCALRAGGAVPPRFHQLPREKLDLSPVAVGQAVLITGYGCVKMEVDLATPDLKPGPFADVFNIGDEKVAKLGKTVLTTVSAAAKEPALCQGDSGGPLLTGASIADPTAQRRVRAVNSRVGVETHELVSTMAMLSSTKFREFLGCWLKERPDFSVRVENKDSVLPCTR